MLFERRENPAPQKRYQSYKLYLRKDFLFRCAYCLIHEAHYGGLRNFHVDHFRPKNKKEFRELALVYSNLYYACGLCNTFKSDWWPSAEDLAAGRLFVDPCEEDPYGKHFEVNEEDGTLRVHTPAGQYTAEHIWLDRPQLNKHRRRLLELKRKWQECRDLLNAKGIPAEWLTKARQLLDEIEREYLNPAPPYEPEDVGS
jgi:uncharacterized protein (TIGR02646 family)